MHDNDNDNNDALVGARGIAIGLLISLLLWLLIVGGVMLCYEYNG
jgi:hypothetical protein